MTTVKRSATMTFCPKPILAGAAAADDGGPESGALGRADEFVIVVERHLVFLGWYSF